LVQEMEPAVVVLVLVPELAVEAVVPVPVLEQVAAVLEVEPAQVLVFVVGVQEQGPVRDQVAVAQEVVLGLPGRVQELGRVELQLQRLP